MPKAISLEKKKDAVVINNGPASAQVNAHPRAGDGRGRSCPAWVLISSSSTQSTSRLKLQQPASQILLSFQGKERIVGLSVNEIEL